jgi:amino acid transporter
MLPQLEIILLSLPLEAILGLGFIVMTYLCVRMLSKSQRVFPIRWLVIMWGLTALAFFAGPELIRAYAHGRLTDADNLFMLPAAEVGPSYAVLNDAFHRWSDAYLALLTGSVFILSGFMVVVAYLSALILRGLYGLISAKVGA